MRKAHFKKYVLLYVLIPILVLTTATSYYRFIVINDYIVSYEGECDPASESCYVDCVDEACEEEYYFTIVEREAKEIYKLCGGDITDCEEANYCPTGLESCSVTYCDSETDECAIVNTTEL